MEVEIKMKDGRVVRVEFPAHKTITSTQLEILVRWAIEGRRAEIILD